MLNLVVRKETARLKKFNEVEGKRVLRSLVVDLDNETRDNRNFSF